MTPASAAMLVAILAVQSCSDESSGVVQGCTVYGAEDAGVVQGRTVYGAEDAKMSPSIQEVKAKYEHQLLAKPGVVSVGIGRDDEGNPVIVVGLDAPRTDTLAALPKDLDGYRVRTEVTGPLKAQ